MREQEGGSVIVVEALNETLHESVTEALNPLVATIVTAEVADPPGEIDAGESAVADIVKPG